MSLYFALLSLHLNPSTPEPWEAWEELREYFELAAGSPPKEAQA